MADDGLDKYRKEYNKMLLEKATGANSIVQDKYVTVSVCKKNIEEARNYVARVGADLIAHFSRLGSHCVELEAEEKLRIFHDFYRTGEETAFRFDISQTMRKGHDFKDFICTDTPLERITDKILSKSSGSDTFANSSIIKWQCTGRLPPYLWSAR